MRRTETNPAPGLLRPSEDVSKDRMVTFDEEQGSFVTVSFPTAYPASRKEVAELSRIFDQMFASVEGEDGSHARIRESAERGDADGILGVWVPQNKALDAVLHETMRQVSTQSRERGDLLSKLRHHQERLFGEAAHAIRSLGQQLGLERAKNRAAGLGNQEETQGTQAMCDKLMGIVDSLMEERDNLSGRCGPRPVFLVDAYTYIHEIETHMHTSRFRYGDASAGLHSCVSPRPCLSHPHPYRSLRSSPGWPNSNSNSATRRPRSRRSWRSGVLNKTAAFS